MRLPTYRREEAEAVKEVKVSLTKAIFSYLKDNVAVLKDDRITMALEPHYSTAIIFERHYFLFKSERVLEVYFHGDVRNETSIVGIMGDKPIRQPGDLQPTRIYGQYDLREPDSLEKLARRVNEALAQHL